jgi:hypothetical protein
MVSLAFVDNFFPGVHRHHRDCAFDLGLPLRSPRLHHELFRPGHLPGSSAPTQDSPHSRCRDRCRDSVLSVFNPATFRDILTPAPGLDMPTLLRLIYSRFAAQEALSNKLDCEAAEEDPDAATDSPADGWVRRPDADV